MQLAKAAKLVKRIEIGTELGTELGMEIKIKSSLCANLKSARRPSRAKVIDIENKKLAASLAAFASAASCELATADWMDVWLARLKLKLRQTLLQNERRNERQAKKAQKARANSESKN